jgi:hypothetical protein
MVASGASIISLQNKLSASAPAAWSRRRDPLSLVAQFGKLLGPRSVPITVKFIVINQHFNFSGSHAF